MIPDDEKERLDDDWPLPSHPEYPPEDEALVVPRDDNQKENES